jgi:phage terminase large subunit-like protein
MAGNQLGKTVAGGAEWAMHLTGRYPDNWDGATFSKPPLLWAGSVTGESTRDNPQRILIGPPAKEEEWGTGFIPHECLKDWNRAMGVPNLLDNAVIKWGGGGDVQAGESIIAFKAYEKGREKWQGPTVDGVWFDEEPDEEIYSEGMTRTNNGQRGPFGMLTFTPLKGMSTVVCRFIMPAKDDEGAKHRNVTQMTIDDAEHYSPERRAQIIASYPAHEREARAKGIPIMGSGRVFPIAEEEITVSPFPIPPHWPRIGGLDFGYDHPFAAVEVVWDRDSKKVYVTKEYRNRQGTPVIHGAAIKPWAPWLPWAWPHDGLQHDKGSGEQLAKLYKDQGLKLTDERAQFADDRGHGVEAGILEMLDWMQTGRFKVFSTCTEWFEEFRLYHRDEGEIVKERDDLMAATRYACMMLRFAKVAPMQERKNGKPKGRSSWAA